MASEVDTKRIQATSVEVVRVLHAGVKGDPDKACAALTMAVAAVAYGRAMAFGDGSQETARLIVRDVLAAIHKHASKRANAHIDSKLGMP
jgi:hypothetical protein